MTEQLLRALDRRANRRGRVIVNEIVLLEELDATHENLIVALDVLVHAHRLEILSPLPFLVAKLSSWPSSNPVRDRKEQQGSSLRPSAIEGPVSSSIVAAATEDGGAGEGEQLLNAVIAVLGPEASRDEFRHLLSGRHPALIHRALKRVQATKQIRVSKPALFRSLLEKLSH